MLFALLVAFPSAVEGLVLLAPFVRLASAWAGGASGGVVIGVHEDHGHPRCCAVGRT